MRLFVALPIPDEVCQRLTQAQARLQRLDLPLRMAKPEGLHLTLAFLGETREKLITDIQRAMDRATRGTAALSLVAEGLGCFPNARRPRVVWAGLSGDVTGVARLQERLAAGLRESGFTLEDRPFQPHVTLGRARERRERRPAWSADEVEALQRALSQPAERYGSWRAGEMHLMLSELRREGSQYTTLYTSQLG